MRDKLPVYIENRELPYDEYIENTNHSGSYGYVNILLLTSVITTIGSIITIIIFRK